MTNNLLDVFEEQEKKENIKKESKEKSQQIIEKESIKIIDNIDFNLEQYFENIAKSSEFKRMLYRGFFGYVSRGTNESIDNEIEEAILFLRKFKEEQKNK